MESERSKCVHSVELKSAIKIIVMEKMLISRLGYMCFRFTLFVKSLLKMIIILRIKVG